MEAGCGFKQIVAAGKKAIKNKIGKNYLSKLIRSCMVVVKKMAGKKSKTPRIILVPKKVGVLPLIPIFAGLSALDALTGGVANVVKVINDLKSNRNSPVHLGKGMYLTPYKGSTYKIEKGDGLYVAPYKSGGGGSRKISRKSSKNSFLCYPIERCTIMKL